jgi:NAD-dependent SIR2 family protein deacetylase
MQSETNSASISQLSDTTNIDSNEEAAEGNELLVFLLGNEPLVFHLLLLLGRSTCHMCEIVLR